MAAYWSLSLTLAAVYLTLGANAQETIRIGLALNPATDQNLTETVHAYFDATARFYRARLTLDVIPIEIEETSQQLSEGDTNATRSEPMDHSNWLTNAEVAISQNLTAIVGTYCQHLENLSPENLPYFTTDPDFYDQLHTVRNWTKTSRVIFRHRANDVIQLLPVLAAMFEPMKRYVYKRVEIEKGPKNQTVVIAENSDDMDVFVGNQMIYGTQLLVMPFILPKHASVNRTRQVIAQARKIGSSLIFIHSQDPQYITKIFETAMSLDMMTYLYDWVLTYMDMDGLFDALGPALLSNCSSVLGFQLVNRTVFQERGLEVPADEKIIQHALLLDTLDIMVKSAVNGPLDGSAERLWGSLQAFPEDWEGALGTYESLALAIEAKTADNRGVLGAYGAVTPVVENSTVTAESRLKRVFIRNTATVDWKEYRTCRYSSVHRATFKVQLRDDLRWNEDEVMNLPPVVATNTSIREMPIFNRQPVKVALAMAPPFVFEETTPAGEKNYSGLMIDYLNIYARALNVTFVYEFVNDDAGKLVGDRWTGSIGHLINEEVSLAIGGVTVNTLRSHYVDFTDTIFPGMLSTLMKRPEIPSTAWQFLYPFSWVMWVSILIVFVMISGLLCVMDRVDWTDDNLTPRENFYYVAGLLLSGSTDTNPQSSPSRILVGCFMFFSIVVFQSYVANMAAFLTTRDDFEDIPQSVQDLISQSSMQLAAMGEADIIISQSTKEPLLGLSNKLLGEDLHYNSYDEAVTGLRNGSFGDQALILVSSTTQYYAGEYCDVMYLHHSTDAILYALALPKGSQIKGVLDTVITRVRELGEDMTIMDRWYRQNPDCEHSGAQGYSANLETKSLSFVEMIGVFIVILIGVGVATFVGMLGELWRRFPVKGRKGKGEGKQRIDNPT